MAGFLVLAVGLFGGASRADEAAQLPVRFVAILALAATFWPLEFTSIRKHWLLLVFALACMALPIVQLIPMPSAWWAALPGHFTYSRIAIATGTQGWRPLSLTPDLTANAVQALLVPAAALLAALHLSSKDRKTIAGAFVGLAFASAFLGLAQLAAGGTMLRLFEHSSEDAPIGLFANRNHQAALLACALPICAAVVPRPADQTRRMVTAAFLVAAVLIFTVVVFLTGSRMGVLLLALATVGAAWILNSRGLLRRLSGRIAVAALSAAALATIVIAAAVFIQSGILERLQGEDIAADTRGAALPSLIATAVAFLPTGAGFGSFDSVYRQFEPDALLSNIYLNQAHNEPLQLAIEGGVPALLLLLAFSWWWTRTAAAIVRRAGDMPRRGLPLAAVVVTILLIASSLVDYPLRTPLLAALFAFCCAEMAKAVHRDDRAGDPA